MMQWVIYVSLGLVLIVSTTHGEDNAIVKGAANNLGSEFSLPCLPGEFQCQDGTCIPLLATCNYEPNCAGGEDEQNCQCEFHCQSGRYSWWDESRDPVYWCIKNRQVCDGLKDCMDGEDEADCECAFRCDAGHQHGDTNRTTGCLPLSSVCNGRRDCIDRQDEQNCPCDFQCNSATGGQQCIQQRDVCDSWKDCDGGEDEENCPCEYKCEKGVHRYYFGNTDSSRTCIKLKDVCDKMPDCADGQDEVGCNY